MRGGFGLVGMVSLVALASCTDYGPSQVAPPNAISVKAAFTDVALGLTTFRTIVDAPDTTTGETRKLGLVACRVIVHFNISASANQANQFGATLAAPIEAFKASASVQAQEADAAQRGNSVLVDLGSINSDICSAYEKPSDMYPPPAASSDQKGTQNTTGTANQNGNNQSQNGNPSGQQAAQPAGRQRSGQTKPGAGTETGQGNPPKPVTSSSLASSCNSGNSFACQLLNDTIMSVHESDPSIKTNLFALPSNPTGSSNN